MENKEKCRLIEVLMKRYPQNSRSNLKKLIEHHCVKVNGQILSKATEMVTLTDDIQLVKQEQNPLKILYEDQDMVVIDKPAGLLSMANDKEKENTAYHLLRSYLKTKIFIVHRLDQETSGVLIYAKNEKMKYALQNQWQQLVLKREYIALVEGCVNRSGTMRCWLKEDRTQRVYSSHKKNDGKEAITHYEPLISSKRYSLLKVSLETGRKNQIRVAMMDLGHPIVGDRKYGSTQNPIQRLGLHASCVMLIHPYTKKKMTFSSEVPSSFYQYFKKP